MNFSSPKLIWMLAGAMFATGLPAQGQTPIRRNTRPIIFSETKQDTGTTNLDQGRRTALESLENDLKKPFEIFDLADPTRRETSFPAVKPAAPNLNSRQLRGLLEKNRETRDWAFRNQQDYEADIGLTAESMFKLQQLGPDGKEKSKQTPVERFYERMDRERLSLTNSTTAGEDYLLGKKKDANGDDWGRSGRDRNANLGTPAEQAVRRLNEDRELMADNPGKPKTISDLFGLGGTDPAVRDRAQQELQVDKFRKIIGMEPAGPAGGLNSLGSTAGAATPSYLSPTRGLAPLPSSTISRESFNSLSASVGTPLQPLGLPIGGGLPSIATPPPKPPTPVLHPPPTFSPPKRKF